MDLNIQGIFNILNLFNQQMWLVLFIVIITPIIAKIVKRAFFRIEKTSKLHRKRDITRHVMARKVTIAMIYLLGLGTVFYVIPELRALSVGLFAGVGVMGLVIGLAAQDALSNIIAGISLAIFQPFRLGDRLKISGEQGIVEDITFRHTVIRTWENKRIIIPNHIISKDPIVNFSIEDEKILKYLDISISYDSDIDLSRKIILEEIKKHPAVLKIEDSKDINTTKLPVVRMRRLKDNGVSLRALFWTPDQPTATRIGYELLESIKKRFCKEGVEIPYPYRTIVYKKNIPKPKKLKKKK